jgi:AcrR family transcriptional regulator
MTSKINKINNNQPTQGIRSGITNDNLLLKRRREIVLKSSKVFLKKGFDRTTVPELAKEMGMSVGGLYRYIGSKEDFIRLIIEHMDYQNYINLTEHSRVMDKLPPIEALTVGIEIFYKLVDELETFYNFLNHVMVNLSPENRKKLVNSELNIIVQFESVIKRGIALGLFKAEDPSYLAHLIVLAGHGWANRNWYLKDKYTIEQYIQKTIDHFLKQMMAPSQGDRLR